VYAREVEGRTLTFGVSGKLVRNSLVMFDRQTGSLWSHLTGESISGPLHGKHLRQLNSAQTTWGLWLKEHPNTVLLQADRSDVQDPYQAYYSGGDTGIISIKRSDNRLPPKQRVLGIRLGGEVKAYDFKALARDKVVNDHVGGTPLVIVFDGGSESGAVYRSDPGGTLLRFSPANGVLQLTDAGGSAWDGLTGTAVSGPLVGQVLEPVPITYSFWFGWADFYPNTEVYK
jgi:uncharacterized protein DUF3179